mgnify:CR=1 FL=1
MSLGISTYLVPVWESWPENPLTSGRNMTVRYIRSIQEFFEERRLDCKLVVYTVDEPDSLDELREASEWGKLVGEASGEVWYLLTTYLAYVEQESVFNSLREQVDVWAVQVGELAAKGALSEVPGDRERWFYTALTYEADAPTWELDYLPVEYRIVPWLCYRENYTGILYWSVNYWSSDPWSIPYTAPWGDVYNGEGLLVYPLSSVDEPYAPSMRLKWLRDGLEDYEYLLEVERRLGREGAQAIAGRLAESWINWTRSEVELLEARAEAAELLEGRTYHVATWGDDSNPGTASMPLRTIAYALSLAEPGDKIIVHEGTYHESLLIEKSGVEGAPITLEAAEGETVVLDGIDRSSDGISLAPNVSHIVLDGLKLKGYIWGVSLQGGNRDVSLLNIEVWSSECGIHLTVGVSGESPWYGPVEDVLVENCSLHHNVFSGLDCTPGPCFSLVVRESKAYCNGIQEGFGADGIAVEAGEDIAIESCMVYNNSGDGIDIGSRNPQLLGYPSSVRVDRCIVSYNRLNGVKLWTGGTVVNCVIYGSGLCPLCFIYNGEYKVLNTLVALNT